jgi:hypothetical protein
MPGDPTGPAPAVAAGDGPDEGGVTPAMVSEHDVELPFDAPDAPAAASAGDTAPGDAAPGDTAPGDAGKAAEAEQVSTDDPEEATRRKLALLAEAEAIVATPDKNESGHPPDDRHLTERMRAVENVWRRVGHAGDREIELRARLQELRQAYAAARSRRAEARAVDRARAAETKRALLVQAFALAQQVDPSIAMPTAPSPRPPVRRRPSPAMLARRPVAEPAPDTPVGTPAPVAADGPAATDRPDSVPTEPPGADAGAPPSPSPDAAQGSPEAVSDSPEAVSDLPEAVSDSPEAVSADGPDTAEAVLAHEGASEA